MRRLALLILFTVVVLRAHAQDDGIPLFGIQGAHTVYELALSAVTAHRDGAGVAPQDRRRQLMDHPRGRGIGDIDNRQAAEAVERLTSAVASEDSEDAHEYLSEAYAALGRRDEADRERAIVARMRQEALRRAGAAR